MTSHSPAEWVAFLALGAALSAAAAVVYFLLVDAERSDFDPRPWLRRALESGRLDPVLIVVGPVLHDARKAARRFVRDAAVVAALLMILNRAPEATR